jgi:head-tail adaptor
MSAPAFTGLLTQRVTLEVPTDQPDGGGGVSRTWADARSLWARVERLEHDPALTGGRIVHRPVWRITLHRQPLPPQLRVRWLGRVLTLLERRDDPTAPDRIVLLAAEEDVP